MMDGEDISSSSEGNTCDAGRRSVDGDRAKTAEALISASGETSVSSGENEVKNLIRIWAGLSGEAPESGSSLGCGLAQVKVDAADQVCILKTDSDDDGRSGASTVLGVRRASKRTRAVTLTTGKKRRLDSSLLQKESRVTPSQRKYWQEKTQDLHASPSSAVYDTVVKWLRELEECRRKSSSLQGAVSGSMKVLIRMIHDGVEVLANRASSLEETARDREYLTGVVAGGGKMKEEDRDLDSRLDEMKRKIEHAVDPTLRSAGGARQVGDARGLKRTRLFESHGSDKLSLAGGTDIGGGVVLSRVGRLSGSLADEAPDSGISNLAVKITETVLREVEDYLLDSSASGGTESGRGRLMSSGGLARGGVCPRRRGESCWCGRFSNFSRGVGRGAVRRIDSSSGSARESVSSD